MLNMEITQEILKIDLQNQSTRSSIVHIRNSSFTQMFVYRLTLK